MLGKHEEPVVEVVHAAPRRADALERWLTDDERERAAAMRVTGARDRFTTAHALLRLAVADSIGAPPDALVFGATCRHCGGPHGRPELRAPGGHLVHLSLSRTGSAVAVAITRLGPVGLDVEGPVADDFERFDDVALTPSEQRAVTALDPDDRAGGRATLWARKEAVLKATGDGLLVEPHLVEVSGPNDPARLVAWHAGSAPATMQLVDVALPTGTRGAVAVLSTRLPELVIRSGEDLLDR